MKLILLFVLIFGPLALVKLCYAFGTVMVLPRTKGALFVSTSRKKIRAILEALPLSPETKLVDLGCGDGRFLRAVYRKYGVIGVGFEINPWAYFLARLYHWLTGCPAKIRRRDFMKEDLSGYQVVFCYLFPDLLLELTPKLKAELRPGAIVISCNFPLPGLVPWRVLEEDDPIYFYRF